MNINKLFDDNYYLEKELIFDKHIKVIEKNSELVESHIEKSKHNIEFFNLNIQ